jgi:hypothetical protein
MRGYLSRELLVQIILLAIPILFPILIWINRSRFSEADDLLTLVRRQTIAVHAAGQSITHIVVELRNLTFKMFKRVLIAPGTYFIASGPHQNMVLYKTRRLYLFRNWRRRIVVRAACMNATRPVAGYMDTFTDVAKADESLILFLKSARGRNPKIIQAGIWAITDNFSAHDIQPTIATTITSSLEARRQIYISRRQIGAAKRILDKLKIRNRL